MTGSLTLKRLFLEQNFGSANLSFQKLQFFTFGFFGNFDLLLLFLNELLPQKANLLTVLVSVETPGTKNFPL